LSEEADASTCLIGPVIPLRVDSEREVLAPAKSIHYASGTAIGLFRYLFWNEFVAREAMCCDKRHQVAEKLCIPDLEG
jgi:hypothetical protein